MHCREIVDVFGIFAKIPWRIQEPVTLSEKINE